MVATASRYLVCHALTAPQHAQAVAVGVPELSTLRGKVRPGPADELVIVSRAPWDAVRELEITRKAWSTAGARVHIVPLSEWLSVTRPPPPPAPVVVNLGAITVEFEPTPPPPPPKAAPVIVEGPPVTAERLPEQFPYPGTFGSGRRPTQLYRYDVAEKVGWTTGHRRPGDCSICGARITGYGRKCGYDAAHTTCLRTAQSDLAAIPSLIAGCGAPALHQAQANRLVLGGRLRWYRVGRRVVLALPEWGAR